MFEISGKGNFNKTLSFLRNSRKGDSLIYEIFNRYGDVIVSELQAATPVDSGKTASSWFYTIDTDSLGRKELNIRNSNINNGVPVAILIQYGHMTGTGGYVEGFDYITPIVDKYFNEAVEEYLKRR